MKTKEEVKNYMQHALKKSSQHERRAILRRVDLYVSHLEYVQQMDIVSRIAYWECAYAVFEYLYRHKQVRRNVGKFGIGETISVQYPILIDSDLVTGSYPFTINFGGLTTNKNEDGYRLTGFLKERKRKRDKEKSPLHPSYKERETEVKEKAQKNIYIAGREVFHQECLGYVDKGTLNAG